MVYFSKNFLLSLFVTYQVAPLALGLAELGRGRSHHHKDKTDLQKL